jgi:NAD(P)H-hydrate epimerase
MRVVTAAQMKRIEENALAFDLTSARLMENAGSAAAAFIRRTFRLEGRNCMIFCGTGNNGGDGFVVARRLYESGCNVVVVLAEGSPHTAEARGMFETLGLMEVPVFDLATDSERIASFLQHADLIIDAIVGTGFHGELQGGAKRAAELIADAIAAVIALDIPSGVTCDTGRACPGAVRADFTVTFDSLKPAHVIPAGLVYCGKVEVVEIGIPPEARADIVSVFGEYTINIVREALPPRKPDAHKGDHGTLLAICGSERYRGAASLATLGALRSGVGICRVASVESVCAAMAARLYEPTYLPLPRNKHGGIDASQALPLLEESLADVGAVLFGCGCGDGEDTAILLEYLLKNVRVPLVVDADGINALSRNIHVLEEASAPVILTPHPGEMARLCGVSVEEIQQNRMGAALEFAAEHGVPLVLKGHETRVATAEGRSLLNPTGGPGLAKGGSGDILAGMIAAFCAQGISVDDATACAVHLHGLAGERAQARLSAYAMLPSELLQDLCEIFVELER